MNIVFVGGGLGNQLFQYAFGQVVRQRSGSEVHYDLLWFRGADRKYDLDKFHINITTSPRRTQRTVHERIANITLPPMDVNNTNFRGYWQTYHIYDQTMIERLRDEFTVKPEFYTPAFLTWRDRIRSSKAVMLHVRRGDYLLGEFKVITPLPKMYYTKALAYMRALISDPEVFVFSDDIAWCRETFTDCHFVDVPEPYLAFQLMRECKHYVIANSTFSWWPAFLAENATVIAPHPWFNIPHKPAHYYSYNKHLLCEHWLRINSIDKNE